MNRFRTVVRGNIEKGVGEIVTLVYWLSKLIRDCVVGVDEGNDLTYTLFDVAANVQALV